MKKKALLLAAALVGSNAMGAQTSDIPETPKNINSVANESAENAMNQPISKAIIIESLQAISKDPTTVKFHSAMCYEMSMPPADTTFTCPNCGTVTQYFKQSFQGMVADNAPGLLRSLKNSQVKFAVDYSDFCSKCCKNGEKQPELRFTTHCLDCSKTFDWNVTAIDEIDQLALLFVSFPITSVDQGQIGTELIEPEKLPEYISHRFLCKPCRDKHGLK